MAIEAIDLKRAAVFDGPDAPADDDLATCVHCGLCLNYCPTYRVTSLESESPRGRIYLMTQWRRGGLPYSDELARHIDLCLGCRTCEAVCPSGVPYGRIIEHGRAELERVRARRAAGASRKLATFTMRRLLPHPGRLAAFAALTRVAQRTGLSSLLPQGRQLPALPARWQPPAGGVARAIGEKRFSVGFLTGCVMALMYPESHDAAVRLLQLAGCDVHVPAAQRCCGALFAHNGDLAQARRLRDVNEAAFGAPELDFLVVDSAGCSSHLKDFYPGLGGKVRDLFEFLAEAGLPEPKREVKVRVTYQDPCHLVHAQRIRKQPRQLLRSLPGVEFVEMPHADICCGSAGIYNAVEPEMSRRILDEKMADLLSVEPELVVTANPGCQMQLQAGMRQQGRRIPVKHLAELMVEAYS